VSLSQLKSTLAVVDAIIVICKVQTPQLVLKLRAEGDMRIMESPDFYRLFADDGGSFDCKVVTIVYGGLAHEGPSCTDVAFENLDRLILDSLGRIERRLLDLDNSARGDPDLMVFYKRAADRISI
jgi:hypothetical protein